MREEKAIMKRMSAATLVALVLIVSATVLFNEKARAEGYITGTVSRDAVTNNPISGVYVDAFEVNFGFVSTGCINPHPLHT